MPSPRCDCVTLEPQLRWALSPHCPRASATHHKPDGAREHASSTWQAQHRPCTRRRTVNNLFGIPPPTAGVHAPVRGPCLPSHPSYPLRPGAGLPWSGPTVEGVAQITLRGALATRAASQCASNRIKPRDPKTGPNRLETSILLSYSSLETAWPLNWSDR